MKWPGFLAVGLSGCCFLTTGKFSNDVLEQARQREHDLQAAVVQDRDPDVPSAEACSDVPVVTFEDIAHGDRAGELVAIDGVPKPYFEHICTQMRCTDRCGHDLPCCNGCSSDLILLRGRGLSQGFVKLVGPGLQCGGFDCAMSCTPFGPRPKRSYRFVGRYGPGEAGGRGTFSAERWCHVPVADP
jgi:hypothetical protein